MKLSHGVSVTKDEAVVRNSDNVFQRTNDACEYACNEGALKLLATRKASSDDDEAKSK